MNCPCFSFFGCYLFLLVNIIIQRDNVNAGIILTRDNLDLICVRLEHKLDCSTRKIEFIDLATFESLDDVKYLDLSHNALGSLDPVIFEGLPNLLNLDLKVIFRISYH